MANEDIKQLGNDLARLRQEVEQLDGRRGSNRAVRQADFTALASYSLKSPAVATGTLATDYAALREDILQLYKLIAKLSNLYGTADK